MTELATFHLYGSAGPAELGPTPRYTITDVLAGDVPVGQVDTFRAARRFIMKQPGRKLYCIRHTRRPGEDGQIFSVE